MCGIVGILVRNTHIAPELLEQATRSLAHRGPDDSGTILLRETNSEIEIGLGHRRLAILDLSPLGHQPMHDPTTGNWIVFNGEIYNFRELRAELEKAGAEFKSHSDTEVVLAAYRVWGESFLTRLGGMFALLSGMRHESGFYSPAIPWASSRSTTTSHRKLFFLRRKSAPFSTPDSSRENPIPPAF